MVRCVRVCGGAIKFRFYEVHGDLQNIWKVQQKISNCQNL